MPEGPEIHLNTDLFLRKYFLNKQLQDIQIVSGKYIRKKPNNFIDFKDKLPAKVIDVDCHGKFAWIKLDNGWLIGIGFGMTGRLVRSEDHPYIRISLIGSMTDIHYSDMRNFGNWFFWDNEKPFEKKLKSLGIDVIDDDNLAKGELISLFRKYNHYEITQALMSQKVLAGVGNYMKSEILYETKIYPYAKVRDLSDDILYKLYKNAVKLAKKAYRIQKPNFANGIPYEKFQEHMKVYNHEYDPLGNKVTRSNNTKDKRTTHWVRSIQVIGKK